MAETSRKNKERPLNTSLSQFASSPILCDKAIREETKKAKEEKYKKVILWNHCICDPNSCDPVTENSVFFVYLLNQN